MAASKFGKAQTTVDIQFDETMKEYETYLEVLKGTQRHIHAYMKSLRALTSAEQILLELFSSIFEASSQVYGPFSKYGIFVGQMETYRATLEDSLRTQLDEPIEDYMKQFELMKKRIDERKRRLVDVDRYRTDYESLQEKGKEPEKVKEKQTKYLNMKRAYDELNEELKQDMPRLLSDKGNFYTPLFAMLIFHEMEYYKESDKACQPVGESVYGFDTQAAHTHAQVITPEDISAHTMEINLDAPVREDEDEFKGGANESEYEPPPQQGLQPPPSYQKPPQQGLQPPPSYQQGLQPPPQQGLQPPQTFQPGKKVVGGPPPAKKMAGPPPGKKMASTGPPPKKVGSLPPRPTPQRGPQGKQAKGLYPFQGQDESELSFNPGDVLIIHKDSGEWWEAELNGRKGVIPGNYVQLI